MDEIVWREEYEVGIHSIDEQHKKLIAIINDLSQSTQIKDPNKTIDMILLGMLNYTNTHFRYEEELFQKHGYALAQEHKEEHEYFIDKISQFYDKFETTQMSVSEVRKFLFNWFVEHIMESDKQYINCFLKNKVH